MLAASGGLSLLLTFLLAPLSLGYLGAERFGVLAAALALAAVLEPIDFGIRNALLSRLAAADGHNDHKESAALVQSAFRLLVVCGMVVFAGLALGLRWLPLAELLGAGPADKSAVLPTVLILGFGLAANIPLGIVDRIYLALQAGHETGKMLVVGHGLSLLLVLGLAATNGGIPLLAGALMIGPTLARVVFGLRLIRTHPELLVTVGADRRAQARKTLSRHSQFFFALQVAVAVGFAADQLVISSQLGSAEVAEYSVPARTFAIVGAVVAVLARPLWPAFADARASRDVDWIRRTFRRTMIAVVLAATVGATVLALLGPGFYNALGRGQISTSWTLLIGLAVWAVLHAAGTVLAAVMNGLEIHGLQLVTGVLMAIANIVSSLWLVQKLGVSGPVWASVGSYLVFIVLPLSLILPRKVAEVERRSQTGLSAANE